MEAVSKLDFLQLQQWNISKEKNYFQLRDWFGQCRGQFTEVVVLRCSVKEMLLKFLQNSQGNTFIRVSFFNSLFFYIYTTPLLAASEFNNQKSRFPEKNFISFISFMAVTLGPSYFATFQCSIKRYATFIEYC